MRQVAAALAALALAALGGASPATADPPDPPASAPANLIVVDGEDSWHPKADFRLEWEAASRAPLAVGYLVRDPAGAVAYRHTGLPGPTQLIVAHVPPAPGAYTAEVWFEGQHGTAGPLASAALRFDDAAPAPAGPLGPSGWIRATSPVLLRIEHPASPWPISGIRGYAISLDRGAVHAPCAGPRLCTPAETDLDGGAGDDTIALGTLPEGVSYVSAVAVSGSGVRSPTLETTPIRVDGSVPEVALRGVPDGWARQPVRLTATASDRLSGMQAAGPGGPFTAISVDGGPAALTRGDTASAAVHGDGVHTVSFFARDAAGNLAGGEVGAPPPGEASLRIDETPPRVAFARAQDPADPERIEATVTDSLSGPDPGRGVISLRLAGSSQSFEPLPTAVSAGRLLARWDSDRYPAGSYELTATAYDRAGNSGSGDRRADGARMVLANPVKEPVTVESGFGGRRLAWNRCSRRAGGRRCHRQVIDDYGRRPGTRTVPYGRGVAYGGRLISRAGAPLPGLPVAVVETFAAGSRPTQRTTLVHTDDDGAFLARLAPGPTREVEATFAGSRLLTRAAGRQARLAVLASVRLRASAATARVGGAPVLFSGRIDHLGARLPGGMPVQLQYRLPGSAWTTFRAVQADAAGRFRYPYAFSDDDSRGVRFQLRAFVAAQEGWPYEPAASRSVAVTAR